MAIMLQTEVQLAQHPPTQPRLGRSLSDAQGGMRTGQECFNSLQQHILRLLFEEQNTSAFNMGFTKYGSFTSLRRYDAALSHNCHCKNHMY